MDPRKQVGKLLASHRFTLIRETKHKIYQNPEGKIFVSAKTPSDHRAWANALSDLRYVIELPAKPMTLAISDFDRESAARRIQGETKAVAGIKGSTRTKGTGIFYEDKILTADDLARRDEQRQLSLESRRRKEDRKEQRRSERRIRRDQRLAEGLATFDLIKPFLDSVHALLNTLWEDNRNAYEAFAANSWWETVGDPDYIGEVDPIFYEFTDTDYLLPVISLRRSLFKDIIDLPVDQKDVAVAARMMLIREEWHATWRDWTGLERIISDVRKALTKTGRETRLQVATSYVLGRAKGFISNHVRVVVANCLNKAALEKVKKPFVEITIGDFIANLSDLDASVSVENALAVTDAVFSERSIDFDSGTPSILADLAKLPNRKRHVMVIDQ